MNPNDSQPQAGGQIPDTDTFVSYASADRERVYAIVSNLEKLGVNCWIAPRDVRPGEEYGTEIISGIRSAKTLIVMLSNTSIHSQNVRAEVERAVNLRKKVYPVRLEEVELGEALEFFLSIRQWVDLFDDPVGLNVKRLADAIKSDAPPEKVAVAATKSPFERWVMPAAVAGAALFGLLIVYSWVSNMLMMNGIQREAEKFSSRIEDMDLGFSGRGRVDNLSGLGVELRQMGSDIDFRVTSGSGWVHDDSLQISVGGAEFVSLNSSDMYGVREVGSVVIRRVNEKGKVEETYDLTPVLAESLSPLAAAEAESTVQVGYDWQCSLGGCVFRYQPISALCHPGVSKAEVSQEGQHGWVEIDRQGCAGEQFSQSEFCAHYSMFPETLVPYEDFQLRISFADGTEKTYQLPMTVGSKSYVPAAQRKNPADEWVPMTFAGGQKGPVPLAVISYDVPGSGIGAFRVLSGLGTCVPAGTREAAPGTPQISWLVDQDGRGLLRTAYLSYLPFGSQVHMQVSKEDADWFRQFDSGRVRYGIAAEYTPGERTGPFFYEFDISEVIRKAADRSTSPMVRCDRSGRRGFPYSCFPQAPLPWVGAKRVAFGADPGSLDHVFDIDFTAEDLLSRNCLDKTKTCEPFWFNVPPGWQDVYVAVTDRSGRELPVERFQLKDNVP